jgi:hypothetical protein
MLNVILYFKLRNFVVSQFGIRNTALVILKKIKTRLNAFFIKTEKDVTFFNAFNHFLINAKLRIPDDLNALKKQRV